MRMNVTFLESDQTFNVNVGETTKLPGGEGGGENGATFIPSVSADGVISWTNDKGLDNPDPVNIAGKTPVKYVDYFTEADTAEMVTAVLGKLPVYNGEAVEI